MDLFTSLAKSHSIPCQISPATIAKLWKYFSKLTTLYSETLKTLYDRSGEQKIVDWMKPVVAILCDTINSHLEKIIEKVNVKLKLIFKSDGLIFVSLPQKNDDPPKKRNSQLKYVFFHTQVIMSLVDNFPGIYFRGHHSFIKTFTTIKSAMETIDKNGQDEALLEKSVNMFQHTFEQIWFTTVFSEVIDMPFTYIWPVEFKNRFFFFRRRYLK